MRSLLLRGLACAGLALFSTDALAHGGQYRGPGDTVPPPNDRGGRPTPDGRGPLTPRGDGPRVPQVPAPFTPRPDAPRPPGPSPVPQSNPWTQQPGMEIGEDLTRWQFWWEFNKDPFIKLKEAVHAAGITTASDRFYMGPGKLDESKDTMRPSPAQIRDEILPGLKRALDATEQRDITSSCMIALAKVGENHETFDILDVFRERLSWNDLEVRETAAVAMGISQMPEAIEDLTRLVRDTSRGRELTRRSEVDDHTRSFAAYGLGLVAHATSDSDVKRAVLQALQPVLDDESIADRNIRVAVINAIGLLRPNEDEKGSRLLADACEALERYWRKRTGPGEQLIQAHCPPAIAKLLAACPNAVLRARFVAEFTRTLRGDGAFERSSDQLGRSCALALGRLATPADTAACEALRAYEKRGKDPQTRYFSLIALGQIGGPDNREHLLVALQQGSKALEKPWAALALGVLAHRQREDEHGIDATIGEQLRGWLRKVRNPETRGALAIALGLAGYLDAADDLRELLEKEKNKDELAGYICIGLALMGDQHAVEPIRNIVETSVRRPERLRQAAIALGKLGDARVAPLLTDMLSAGSTNLARMSAIAAALGFIGDRRSVGPLLKVLFDDSLTDLSRAFAAVAIGGVADKELLPWNSKLAVDMNYRAAVETLTNQQSGILDIL